MDEYTPLLYSATVVVAINISIFFFGKNNTTQRTNAPKIQSRGKPRNFYKNDGRAYSPAEELIDTILYRHVEFLYGRDRKDPERHAGLLAFLAFILLLEGRRTDAVWGLAPTTVLFHNACFWN